MKTKNLLLAISIIALIVFFVVLMYGIFLAPHGTGAQDRGHPVIPTYIISISSIVLIIGLIPLFYYVIYTGLEKNYEKRMEILSKTITDNNKSSEVNDDCKKDFTNVILKFLSYNEKKF